MNENESEKFWSPVLDFHPQTMKLGIQIKLAAAKASKVWLLYFTQLYFGRQLKTVPLAKVQLCEVQEPNFGSFCCSQHLYAKFECPVAHQNFQISLLCMIVKLT